MQALQHPVIHYRATHQEQRTVTITLHHPSMMHLMLLITRYLLVCFAANSCIVTKACSMPCCKMQVHKLLEIQWSISAVASATCVFYIIGTCHVLLSAPKSLQDVYNQSVMPTSGAALLTALAHLCPHHQLHCFITSCEQFSLLFVASGL